MKICKLHILLLAVSACFCFISCSKDTPEIVTAEVRDSLPRLQSDTIITLISDSGITRYRIKTPVLKVYDRTPRPHWDFPDGIRFEKFDEVLQVNAEMQSDHAVYYDKEQLWIFSGQVKAMNLEGETFETDKLFWNDAAERIYSDDTIRITQKDKIIRGQGFESNATLTQYTIRKPTGIIPVDEEEE